MGTLAWICNCGKINVYSATRCAKCSLARALGERKEPDLSKIVKPPPKR